MREDTVYVGLGSNEGDREAHLRLATQRLHAVPGITVARMSSLLESELVGDGPPQGPFLNAVAELRTSLPPAALLGVFVALEAAAGRRRPAKPNHPRPLDLDLLAYGDLCIDTRDLVVPHPRWQDREFVTKPLRELGVDTSAWPVRERPLVLERAAEVSAQTSTWLAGDCAIGLVPTMGALHDGHRSLIARARAECDRVLVTVFVNPLQFGQGEDFGAYPRVPEGDVVICREAGADVVFAPTAEEMYGPDFCSRIAVGRAAEGMEGAVRPGHFEGVATVVAKLFAMCRPRRAYFGEKDAQQLAVIRRMREDLGLPVEIAGCPIVREGDGLAMSSRNVFLAPADRAASTVLFRALSAAREAWRGGERDRDALITAARDVMDREPAAAVEYLELRRESDLRELPAGPVANGRLLLAARFVRGERPVRLIDNMAMADPDEAEPHEAVSGS